MGVQIVWKVGNYGHKKGEEKVAKGYKVVGYGCHFPTMVNVFVVVFDLDAVVWGVKELGCAMIWVLYCCDFQVGYGLGVVDEGGGRWLWCLWTVTQKNGNESMGFEFLDFLRTYIYNFFNNQKLKDTRIY